MLLEGDIGHQVQRPGAAGLPEPAWGLVQDPLERVRLRLIEDRLGVLGSAFLFVQAAHAVRLEGVDGVADGLRRAANPVRDLGRGLLVGAGQQDLGTPKGETESAAKSGLENPALGVRQLANEESFHEPLFATN